MWVSEKKKERNVEYVSSEKEKENKNEEEKENKKEKGTFSDNFHLYFSHYSYMWLAMHVLKYVRYYPNAFSLVATFQMCNFPSLS